MIESHKLMRRVAGAHDIRMDGISDLVLRARGAAVLDVGCNRGLVGFEFANNGARLVHGCDLYEPGIATAREIFIDLRNVQARFEVVDLTRGPEALNLFGGTPYDIVLLLATYHKLKRVMRADALSELMRKLGNLTITYFGWRSMSNDRGESVKEMMQLDCDLGLVGLKRIQ